VVADGHVFQHHIVLVIAEWSIAGPAVGNCFLSEAFTAAFFTTELSLLPDELIAVRILRYFAICPHTWQLPPLLPCIDCRIGSLPERVIVWLKNSFHISRPVPDVFMAMH